MVEARAMEVRLLHAALWRRRGMASLAVLAVAIGSSVAAAMMHVSVDVSRKVGRELKALGPNVLLVPEPVDAPPDGLRERGAAGRFLSERDVRARLAAAGVTGAAQLHATGRIGAQTVPLIGCDLEAARRLHPSWIVGPGDASTLMGVRLAQRLGVAPGDSLTLGVAGGTRRVRLAVGATVEAGGPSDEAWWLPLATAQDLADLDGRVSMAEARLDGDPQSVERALAALDGSGIRALPLHALSETEAGLLERMGRLMLLVTLAALLAGGLAAFGTLTDLALVRRREIALMKSLGAGRRDIVRQFIAESLVIGLLGGLLGWLIGVFFAEIIGREVFHAAIVLHPGVPLLVVALAVGIAVLAGLGPIRLALGVEPAGALKGE